VLSKPSKSESIRWGTQASASDRREIQGLAGEMHHDLFGASLPHSAAGWCFTFFAILGAIALFLLALEQFTDLFGGTKTFFRPLGGLALPITWIIWSAALIYWHLETTTVLSCLGGLFVIAVAMRLMARSRNG
jgi:hypothetical protein